MSAKVVSMLPRKYYDAGNRIIPLIERPDGSFELRDLSRPATGEEIAAANCRPQAIRQSAYCYEEGTRNGVSFYLFFQPALR
jgi:hypothetical protein